MNQRLEALILQSRIILDVMQNAVCIKDTKGRTLYTNQAYEKMIRRSSTELVADGQDIFENNVPIGKVIVYHDISDVNRLKRELDRVNQKLRKAQTRYTFKDIIGQSACLLHIVETAKVASMTPATIMLRGESGQVRKFSPMRFTITVREEMKSSLKLIVPLYRRSCLKVNCSDTRKVHLQEPLEADARGFFRRLTRELSFWMRLVMFLPECR